MTKDELNKLEKITFTEEIPLLDELYVVVSNKKHDSGYKMYKIYGIAYGNNSEIIYAKCLSEWADVINIVPTCLNEWNGHYLPLLSMDSTETNLISIFIRNAKIKVKYNLSTFEFEIVKVPNETTAAAIEEGRKMMSDSSAPRYSSMDALKEVMEND